MNRQNESSNHTIMDDYVKYCQGFFQSLPDGVSIFDHEGRHLWCNDAALEIYGYSDLDEVYGTPNERYIHSDYRIDEMEVFNRVKSGEIISIHETTFLAVRNNGTTFPVHVIAAPIYINGVFVGYQAHSRDMTHLSDAVHRLRSSLSAIDLLASLIQHDLRNDLQIIDNAVEAALMVMDQKTTSSHLLSMAKSGIHRMKGLLAILAPNTKREVETLDEIIEERLCETKEIHVGINAILLKPASMKPVLLSDRRLIAFVFDNLFRNSVKYAGLDCTIVVKIEQDDVTLQVDVVDDGPGIPENLGDTLFQKGTSTSGSGMGLYICRRIVEGYGGKIKLLDNSTLHTGAAFRITLPYDIPDL